MGLCHRSRRNLGPAAPRAARNMRFAPVSSPIKARRGAGAAAAGADATRLRCRMWSNITRWQGSSSTLVCLTGGNWESRGSICSCAVLRGLFHAGLPRHKAGSASARSKQDVAGQGDDGELLLHHSWVPSHHHLLGTPAHQPGIGQSHQTSGVPEQCQGRICPPATMPSGAGGSRDWSLEPAPPRY